MSTQRSYRGLAPDERRRLRREALLEAALDRLVDDSEGSAGAGELSVRSVCAQARLTQRYFYESFANLDDLLVQLVGMIADEVAQAGLAAVADAPGDLVEQCRAGFSGAYSVVRADPRKARAMLVTASGSEPLQTRRRQMVLDYAQTLLDFVGSQYGEQVLSSEAARITMLYAVGGTFELMTAVLGGEVAMPEDDLADLVAALLAGSLASILPDRG